MIPSHNAIALVKSFEGFKDKAYKCPAGVWTIGYGTTLGVKEGQTVTENKASQLLLEDINLRGIGISALTQKPLNQNQFDAICSLVYNIGIGAYTKSTLLKRINEGKYEEAANQFLRWDKVNGKPLLGLTKRRIMEKELFERKV